jgi:hypothetical protein
MDPQDSLLQQIDCMIERLSNTLPVKETEGGWTRKSQEFFLEFFGKLKRALLKGETMACGSIGRGMDHWGIVSGNLLKDADEISLLIDEMSSGKNLR